MAAGMTGLGKRDKGKSAVRTCSGSKKDEEEKGEEMGVLKIGWVISISVCDEVGTPL